MAILITGGTGFLGSNLTRKLISEGVNDIVLMDTFPNIDNVSDVIDKVKLVNGDFSQPTELLEIIKTHKITDIFHLGMYMTESYVYISRAIPVNLEGTSDLFEIARLAGIRRVIWASSEAVYGLITKAFEEKDEPFGEERPVNPSDMYGASKLFTEHLAEAYAQRGLDVIGLRLSSIYGLGRGTRRLHNPDTYVSLIENSYYGRPVVAPPASELWPWTYVKDVANIFYAAYRFKEKPAHRLFNVCGEGRTIGEASNYLKTIFPKADIKYSDKLVTRLGVCKSDLIKNTLGVKFEYSMEKGIQDYIKEMRLHNK